MKRVLFLFFMMVSLFSFAKKWDAIYISKLIASGDIDKVIQYYQDKYYSENRDPQDAFKVAELYVKKKDYPTAMKWYDKEKQLINSSKVNQFNYANTCRLVGEYQKALDGYLMYAAQTGDVKKVMDFTNQCERILKASAQIDNYKLDNYTYNTSLDETNVAYLRNNAVYVTTQSIAEKNIQISTQINQIKREFDGFATPVKAYKNNIPNLSITSLSYTLDGNKVFFSAKDQKGKITHEQIYVADNLGGTFLNPTLLSFNHADAIFKNPSSNDDGTELYFSSNQIGGQGGFDIWKSTLVKNKWTKPVNLGELINTSDDEISPFFVQKSKEPVLYFSSDREGGFGGYDIYLSKNSSDIWQGVEMQEAPINSAFDEISILYDNEIKTGYFTSNRPEGKGGFDVYRYIPYNLRLIVHAQDSATRQPLEYTLVQLKENGKIFNESMTNLNGSTTYRIGKNKTVSISVSKDNYKPQTVSTNSFEKASGDSIVILVQLKKDEKFSILNNATNSLSMENIVIFTGQIMNATDNKPAKNAKMRMVNYKTQKMREIDLDENGRFEIKLLLNNNYKILFDNEGQKMSDEFTTYGLDNNSVKVRDYTLSGSKYKVTNNIVYKEGQYPGKLLLQTMQENKTKTNLNVNEPIKQSKIDSLLKVISQDEEKTPIEKKKQTIVNDITPVNLFTEPKQQESKPNPTATISKILSEIKNEPLEQQLIKKPGTINNTATSTEVKNQNINPAISVKPELTKPVEMNKTSSELDNTTIDINEIPAAKTESQSIIHPNHRDSNEIKIPTQKVIIKQEKNAESSLKETIVVGTVDTPVESNNKNEKNTAESIIIEKEGQYEYTADLINTKAIKKSKKQLKLEAELYKADTVPENKTTNENIVDKQELIKTVDDTETITETTATEVKLLPELEQKTVQTIKESKEEIKPILQPKTEETVALPELRKAEKPDIYYKIQLGSFKDDTISIQNYKHLGKVEMSEELGLYIYRLGEFYNLEQTKEVLKKVRADGYYVAFILQYNKEKVIGIFN